MKYVIYASRSKKQEMTKRHEIDNKKEAYETFDNMLLKNKKIIEIPDVKEGYILKKQGTIYGVVQTETPTTYFVNKRDPEDDMLTPYCKENMDQYFIDGHFDLEEDYI